MEVRLGQRVKYVRLDKDEKQISGEGVVTSIFLNPDRRMQVGVFDAGARFNIDLPAINPTAAGSKRYFDHIATITARSSEINAAVKKMVEEGNAEIDALNTAYFGAPIELEVATDNAKAS